MAKACTWTTAPELRQTLDLCCSYGILSSHYYPYFAEEETETEKKRNWDSKRASHLPKVTECQDWDVSTGHLTAKFMPCRCPFVPGNPLVLLLTRHTKKKKPQTLLINDVLTYDTHYEGMLNSRRKISTPSFSPLSILELTSMEMRSFIIKSALNFFFNFYHENFPTCT